jgi:phospholipase C
MIRKCIALSLSATIVLTGCASNSSQPASTAPAPATIVPTTPQAAIKHVVVIFNENVSFDHYFGTYPNALNLPGESAFTAAAGTPTPNNYISNPSLLTSNPNLSSANGAAAANPYRLDVEQSGTADQNHGYTAEETAFDGGKMDKFPLSVGTADSAQLATQTGAAAISQTNALTMGYYDGNTVTAFWNYAQHYSLLDHSFGTNFGPSTDGAINMISGQTNGVINDIGAAGAVTSDGSATGLTLVSDADPTGDVCSSTSKSVHMGSGKNIGDLLNSAKITWGFFEGGFDLTATNTNAYTGAQTTGCARATASTYIPGHPATADYVPHHQPFQYYASTANLQHTRPTSIAAIGTTDVANHQYDTHDFFDALAAGNMPAVSFLKAPAYQDGHAGYSDPLDEQTFLVNTINTIESSPFWSSTAIIIAYDDSDGWYDHVVNLINGSTSPADTINGAGVCISATAAAAALAGPNSNGTAVQGRCGYGPRLPMVVISPWANKNALDSTVTDQSSITRFIEDIFLGSQRIGTGSFDSIAGTLMNSFNFTSNVAPNPNVVLLSPATGKVTSGN